MNVAGVGLAGAIPHAGGRRRVAAPCLLSAARGDGVVAALSACRHLGRLHGADYPLSDPLSTSFHHLLARIFQSCSSGDALRLQQQIPLVLPSSRLRAGWLETAAARLDMWQPLLPHICFRFDARLLCYYHELLHEVTQESNTMKSGPCYCVNESLKNHDLSYKIQRDKVLHAISEAIIWKQCSLMKLINNDRYIPFFFARICIISCCRSFLILCIMIVGYFAPCFSPHVLVNMKTMGRRKFMCCLHYSSVMVISMQSNSRHIVIVFISADLIYTVIRKSMIVFVNGLG